MKIVGKVCLSLLVFFVVMLIAAAGIEIGFGESRPGYVPMVTLVIVIPVLFLIWRKGHRKG